VLCLGSELDSYGGQETEREQISRSKEMQLRGPAISRKGPCVHFFTVGEGIGSVVVVPNPLLPPFAGVRSLQVVIKLHTLLKSWMVSTVLFPIMTSMR
jgi:hypothetical protein